MVVWLAGLLIDGFAFLPRRPVIFQVVVVILVFALILVCYATGEPPSWRWGDRK